MKGQKQQKSRRILAAFSQTPPWHFHHLEKTHEEKVAFLIRPESYPEPTRAPTVIETHMAWVFLTDRFAYKLKKPVFRPDQDYSTIDARHRDHSLELLLNQRLAEDTYLGVEALRVNANNVINLNGEGYPCDWLLKMRRLPGERMLEHLLKTQQAQPDQAKAIGWKLGQFYRAREATAMSFAEYRDRFRRGIEVNEELLTREATLATRVQSLGALQLSFLEQRGELLDDSLRSNRVVECHGDLRPEHVFVETEVTIIDCLQFCRDYRLMDFFDDASFLALECERQGYANFGETILTEIAATTSSSPPRELLHFYQSFRAAIRARLALLHLIYRSSDDREKWLRKTREYLALAEFHVQAALAD